MARIRISTEIDLFDDAVLAALRGLRLVSATSTLIRLSGTGGEVVELSGRGFASAPVVCPPPAPAVIMRVRLQRTDDAQEQIQRGSDHRRAA